MSVHDWHAHAAARDAATTAPPRLVPSEQLATPPVPAIDLGGRDTVDLAAGLVADLAAVTRVLLGITTGAPVPVVVEPVSDVPPFADLLPPLTEEAPVLRLAEVPPLTEVEPLVGFAPLVEVAPLVDVAPPVEVEPLVPAAPTRVPASRLVVDLGFLDD